MPSPSISFLTGNVSLISKVKGSERVSSIPGISNGGTNLPASFAPLQPATAAEEAMYAAFAELKLSEGRPITAEYYLDQVRAARDSAAKTLGFTPNFNLGDVSKKVTEGIDSLGKKFTEFDINKKFDSVATSAKTFLFGASPEGIAAGTAKDAAKTLAGLTNKSKSDATAAETNAVLGVTNADDQSHLVTLTDAEGFVLTFYAMPEIVENRSVEYEAVAPPQFPGAFQKYRGTTSVQYSVNATFVSRTVEEATRNLMYINRLRGWTMPMYGNKSKNDPRFMNKTGAPPPVLKFKGFRESMVGEVPVVVTSLNWNWPRDVDYIQAFELIDDGGVYPESGSAVIPFPTVIQLAIQMVESFSTDQFNAFNLGEFRLGHFKEAYRTTLGAIAANRATGSAPEREQAQVVRTNSIAQQSVVPAAKRGEAVVSEAVKSFQPPARSGTTVNESPESNPSVFLDGI